MLEFETHNNEEDIVLAPILARIVAFILDGIFMIFITSSIYLMLFVDVIGPIMIVLVPSLFEYGPHVAVFFWFLFIWLYFAGFESSRFQGTFGKYLLKLKVTDEYGEQVTFRETSLRFICKWVSFTVLLIGIFMALFMKKRQTFHDYVVRTIVVKANT